MPTMARSRSAQSAARVLSSGISRRQGAHQVAQKLMTNDLPLHDSTEMGLPERSLSEKSGSFAGITGWGAAAANSEVSAGFAALAMPAGTGTPASDPL